MNVTVGWPVLAMPKRSVIGAALAAIVLATTLVVAPVPLVSQVKEASADRQQRCFTETVRVPVYDHYAQTVPSSYESVTRRTCVNVAHTHPEVVVAKVFVTVAACGIATLYGPWFGVACTVGFGGLEISESLR